MPPSRSCSWPGDDPDRLLIVEVNPHLPRTCSLGPEFTNTLDLDLIDVLVEADGAPFTLPATPPDDVDQAIAERARAFIGDGATLQIGIGAVPNTVAALLAQGDGGGYGIHSEMFTDGPDEPAPGGQGDQRRQERVQRCRRSPPSPWVRRSSTPGWTGTTEVAFVPVQVVNDPTVIARNHSFVSINGALSVDLYGQVVADHIDGRQISGVGGHEDFVAGAELRLDDHSLICLRSTAVTNAATRSRIVPVLPEGSVVSTPRHHTGVVITEHGSADLSGLTVRERAAALADIAHPDFRAELRKVASRLGRH